MSDEYVERITEILMGSVEFVSYDGRYPNLCAGTLVLRVRGELITFKQHSLRSGGGLTNDYAPPFSGEWGVGEWPEEIPEFLRETALRVINENVPHGCCGGCS